MTVEDLLKVKQAVHELCKSETCDGCPFEENDGCGIVRFEDDVDEAIDYIKNREWVESE